MLSRTATSIHHSLLPGGSCYSYWDMLHTSGPLVWCLPFCPLLPFATIASPTARCPKYKLVALCGDKMIGKSNRKIRDLII